MIVNNIEKGLENGPDAENASGRFILSAWR